MTRTAIKSSFPAKLPSEFPRQAVEVGKDSRFGYSAQRKVFSNLLDTGLANFDLDESLHVERWRETSVSTHADAPGTFLALRF
jgi:hypothetical protein